jgi:hypothetical protein
MYSRCPNMVAEMSGPLSIPKVRPESRRSTKVWQYLFGELAFEEATETMEKVKQAFAMCSLWEQEDPAVTSELVGVERNLDLGLHKVFLHRLHQLPVAAQVTTQGQFFEDARRRAHVDRNNETFAVDWDSFIEHRSWCQGYTAPGARLPGQGHRAAPRPYARCNARQKPVQAVPVPARACTGLLTGARVTAAAS